MDNKKIPQGRTKEEIQQHEKIIKDFYAAWNATNPESVFITQICSRLFM